MGILLKPMVNALTICILISSVYAVLTMGQDRKVYIAYMGFLPEGEYSPSLHHSAIIKQIVDPSFANKSLIRSYKRSFNGFAAYLSAGEQKKLAGFDGVLSVFPCQKLRLQTTRSWDFMGFPRQVKRNHGFESDIIIGVIDSGIWPESDSFNDEGLGPIPKKWKGECSGGQNFTCNKKIIGARRYGIEIMGSARDESGHGTHVASIAAGNEVKGANYYGLAEGVARGGVPSARLAVYKACAEFCTFTDVVNAFDDAIADGVDIISISMGGDYPVELDSDPISIGAFHAIARGILTVTSAGNTGPGPYTANGWLPWILSVGASYTDRRIIDKVLLGEDTTLVGNSINAFPSSDGELPLVYGKEVTRTCSETDARRCFPWCIEPSLVKNKVLLCDHTSRNPEVDTETSAFGYIMPNYGINVSDVTPLPVAALSADDIDLVKSYKDSTREPVVKILKSELINNPAASMVVVFSSRGPVKWIPDIIKPDVVAPGVEILAAYSPLASPSANLLDKRSVKYNILSGTSMACPHVTAAAAFVKSFHPDWSPSAIKSALMTTAWEINDTLHRLEADFAYEFAYGSGHIDPLKATNPGLVYETSMEDYHKVWCNISYKLGSSTSKKTNCSAKLTHKELNYPSMAVKVDIASSFAVSFPRTVTNVGPANSTYIASLKGGSRLKILVEPNSLQFTAVNQNISFVVTVEGRIESPLAMEHESLIWTDGTHKVRSPILVYTSNDTSRGKASSTSPSYCRTSPSYYLTCLSIMLFIIVHWY